MKHWLVALLMLFCPSLFAQQVPVIACPSENGVFVAELLNWRVEKLILHP